MNQYEKGKHAPDISTVERLAVVLDLPPAYFYAADDQLAELLRLFHSSDHERRLSILRYVRSGATPK